MPRKKIKKSKFKKKGLQKEIRQIFENHPNQKYNQKTISAVLKINDNNLRKMVLMVLKELKEQEFLKEYERGQFTLNENYTSLFTGKVDATSKGSAYIIVDELEEDVFIPPHSLHKALHGDIIEGRIVRKRKRKWEGEVIRIIERKTTQFVGTLDIHQKFAFLILDDKRINIDIYLPLQKLKKGKQGEKAMARITSWPNNVDNPYGEIIQIIGKQGSNNAEMLSILGKNQFPLSFPEAIIKTAQGIGIELEKKEIEKRKDLRKKLTFTIDPFDAKDFDDALSFEALENGHFEVGVHIADVSHYVTPGTPLDEEAYKRGNSIYLEDRVIPMLPEQLSNVACSLRPREDKYAFSAIFEIDGEGKIYKEWFGKTVICSDQRFTYEEAQEIIEGKKHPLSSSVLTLHQVAQKSRKKRIENGALSIASEEVSFLLDEEGNPVGVKRKTQKEANKLIEEFMLLANKRVALFVGKIPDKKEANSQFIYRCHDDPSLEKLKTFSVFINKFDYELEFKDTKNAAKKINALLDKIKDLPEFGIIQSMAIRSMAKAEYQTHNIGHYGLGFDFYTHFTSPIRRYADLMVHRILEEKLENKKKNYGNRLHEICKYISAQERKAIDAERESNKFFQAKYIKEKIGETFEGTISGLADFGMFVKINENACEGMIPIKNLPDDIYYFDKDKFQIIGRQTKNTFNFGDQVKVEVKEVNLSRKEIDLILIEE